MFSATFSDEIRTLSRGFLRDPHSIDVAPRNSTVERIAQQIHPVDRDRKAELLAFLIGHHRWSQVLVFTRTKHGADKLVHSLERDGITAAALHGNKSQNARTRALADFKNGAVRALVATDIAARGIDIDAAAARRQFRTAERRRGLCASHRPHRPRRRRGPGGVAGVHRRTRPAARHRAR